MNKPVKPKKKIYLEGSAPFYDWEGQPYSKKVSLKAFLAWVQSTLPSKAEEVTIQLDDHWEYDDVIFNLELSWKKGIPNPSYEKEKKKYKDKLAKWKKQCQK